MPSLIVFVSTQTELLANSNVLISTRDPVSIGYYRFQVRDNDGTIYGSGCEDRIRLTSDVFWSYKCRICWKIQWKIWEKGGQIQDDSISLDDSSQIKWFHGDTTYKGKLEMEQIWRLGKEQDCVSFGCVWDVRVEISGRSSISNCEFQGRSVCYSPPHQSYWKARDWLQSTGKWVRLEKSRLILRSRRKGDTSTENEKQPPVTGRATLGTGSMKCRERSTVRAS